MPLEPLKANTAVVLSNSAVLASLVRCLAMKGVLSVDECREIYEQALLLLEEQAGASVDSVDVFDAARELIEQHLRR